MFETIHLHTIIKIKTLDQRAFTNDIFQTCNWNSKAYIYVHLLGLIVGEGHSEDLSQTLKGKKT